MSNKVLLVVLCRYGSSAYRKMASNPNRFIPQQWLEADRAMKAQMEPRGTRRTPYEPSVFGSYSRSHNESCNNPPYYLFGGPANIQTYQPLHCRRGQKQERTDGQSISERTSGKEKVPNSLKTSETVKTCNSDKNKTRSATVTSAVDSINRNHTTEHTSSKTQLQTKLMAYSQTNWRTASVPASSTLPLSYNAKTNHPYMRTHRNHYPETRGYQFQSHRHKSDVPFFSAAPGTSTGMSRESHQDNNQRFKLTREWEGAKPSDFVKNENSNKSKKFRIVSYNILSQKLLDLNRGLYKHCDPDILPWQYRWPNLENEIKSLDADILCLQEIEEHHFCEMISPSLTKLGYHIRYKRRTGHNPNKPDGVLTAYKKEHFELVAMKEVEYYRGEIPLVNQHNVGVITLLRPKLQEGENTNNGCICVVNTHLLYSPKRGDIKLVQLSTLFAEVHNLISKNSNGKIPILLCGDFNSTSTSLLYRFITEQEICYKGFESKYVSGQRVSERGYAHNLPDPLLPKCLNISEQCLLKSDQKRPKASESNKNDLETKPQRRRYQLKHSLGPLKSVHEHRKNEATTTQDHGITVDYIFYSSCGFKISSDAESRNKETDTSPDPSLFIHLLRRLRLVSQDDMKQASSIPNPVHCSDHIPVAAEFLISPFSEVQC